MLDTVEGEPNPASAAEAIVPLYGASRTARQSRAALLCGDLRSPLTARQTEEGLSMR